MKTISLKIDDHIFQETEKIVGELQQARNRYINEALASYNRIQRRKLLKEQLAFESELVREDSMEVLADFDDTLQETLPED
jgi:predicted transcriptional regulator